MHLLDKYDQFYRVVGQPFINLDVTEFIEDLDSLILTIESDYETKNTKEKCNLDKIPYVKFLEHFKD